MAPILQLVMSIFKEILQPKVFLNKWGISGRRLKILMLAIGCILAVFLLYYKFQIANLEAKKNFYNQTAFYCNAPKTVHGEEGKLPSSLRTKYELVQVQMAIRHGDRAPIDLDTLPNTESVKISCIFDNNVMDYEKLHRLRHLSSMFDIHGNPKRRIIQEREVCVGGQLTPIGFIQHIHNGEHLRAAYSELLKTIKSSSQILTMTTDYSRTVQSPAALLFGMFDEKFQNEKLKINVNRDKYPETHFLKDEKGEAISCPILINRLRNIWQTKDLIKLRASIDPIRSEFAGLFNTDSGKIASLDRLIDVLYTRTCHGKLLPLGPNGKVSFNLASRSFELSHKLITSKHTPLAELQTLSMLSQIVQHAGGLIAGQEEKKKLVIFSGHDTVLVPLLAILGVHDGKWPPYASRVIFELWKGSNDDLKEHKSDLYVKFNGYFIRVLYNGVSVTHNVKFCVGKTVEGELCPLSEFVRHVTSNEFNGSNFFNRIKNICAVS